MYILNKLFIEITVLQITYSDKYNFEAHLFILRDLIWN